MSSMEPFYCIAVLNSHLGAQRQKRAVAEYLAAIAAEQSNHTGQSGSNDGDRPEQPRRRETERKRPKVISPSDPASAWTAKANKRVQFGYGLNYLIDTANAVIVAVERRLPEPMTRSRRSRR